MTPVGHLAVTSIAGNNPITCLLWGFISHWILDEACSEYRPLNIWQIIYEAIIAICFLLYTKCWWCLLGLLPDVIEGFYILIKGIEVWQSGKLLFWFHQYKGEPIWSYKKTIVVEILMVAIVLIILRRLGNGKNYSLDGYSIGRCINLVFKKSD